MQWSSLHHAIGLDRNFGSLASEFIVGICGLVGIRIVATDIGAWVKGTSQQPALIMTVTRDDIAAIVHHVGFSELIRGVVVIPGLMPIRALPSCMHN